MNCWEDSHLKKKHEIIQIQNNERHNLRELTAIRLTVEHTAI
jgi:hypothetical protein